MSWNRSRPETIPLFLGFYEVDRLYSSILTVVTNASGFILAVKTAALPDLRGFQLQRMGIMRVS